MDRLITTGIFCLLFAFVGPNLLLNIGDKCPLGNGVSGVCVAIDECNYAAALLRQGKRPVNCGFIVNKPIVCCPRNLNNDKITYGERSKQECLNIRMSDEDGNPRPPVYALAGGERSEIGEYPHMARLGIGQNRNNIEWHCGGSLISRTFILTAAHCIHSKYGTINWARLGEATNDSNFEYIEVIRNFIHPNYNGAFHYNDIAISELAAQPKYSLLIGPACLHNDLLFPTNFGLTVTGWGATEFGGDGTKNLLKANVSLFTYQECNSKYSTTNKKLPNGIHNETQLCAGGRNVVKDTCQGDSGGPIQIPNSPFNIYKSISTIVGITSFGKLCGFENQPGVYVRIYPYLPWIENIVWNT